MRILLVALTVSISACAAIDVPEVSRDLRDYTVSDALHAESIELAQPQATAAEVEGQPAACFPDDQMDALEAFIVAAQANTEMLDAAIRALKSQRRELRSILAAGQAAEAQADLYRSLYVGAAEEAHWTKIAAGGGTAFVMLVLGAAAL